jgi:uncharacterized membrane protein YeaQ/YmgE (transglycosylase-associated protein family)
MDISHLAVQLLVAIACAVVANILIPRQIPGRVFGLVATGLVGVWLGEVGYHFLRSRYGLTFPLLDWNIQGVPLLPSILGSAVVIYITTTILRWTRYNR